MTFYSLTFLIYFVCLLIVLRCIKNANVQKFVYLFGNMIFYANWDIRFFLVIVVEIVLVYYFALLIEKKREKWCVVLPTIVLIFILGYFKYFNFFITSFCNMFRLSNSIALQIILPLGISFYTFQAMSYLFDVYHRKISVEKDFFKVAVYISFFPQIISGPIVKAKDFLPQLSKVHYINGKQISEGIQIFLMGLIKKVVIADRIGSCVNSVYAAPTAYDGISVIFAIVGYAIQIYCDFSGYSDMAIGIGRMMGFDLGKNFNLPYLAKNPSDFWRRWHISLSTWFRDYLYIPLGGNRKGKGRTYINLVITMIVSGLWHGANWKYALWGLIHGIASATHKAFRDIVKSKNLYIVNNTTKAYVNVISLICNNLFILITWIIFGADDLTQAGVILKSVFNVSGIHYISPFIIVYLLLVVAVHGWAKHRYQGEGKYIILNLKKFKAKIIFCVCVLLTCALMYVGESAFIYAQF